jgi:hypothetical protein
MLKSRRNTFTETVRFRAPPGFSLRIMAAAERDCSTLSAWIRRACLRSLGSTPHPHSAANSNTRGGRDTETSGVDQSPKRTVG